MADKSLLLALASSERGGSKPKINTFYIQSLRFLLVQFDDFSALSTAFSLKDVS